MKAGCLRSFIRFILFRRMFLGRDFQRGTDVKQRGKVMDEQVSYFELKYSINDYFYYEVFVNGYTVKQAAGMII